MTSSEFIIWLKGFTEACNDFHPTPKQWDRLKEVLEDVQDYDDNPGLDDEINSYYPNWPSINKDMPLSGSASSISVSSNDGNLTHTKMVWNDKMACWHHVNYPEGFGYYVNSTADIKKEKQQLND